MALTNLGIKSIIIVNDAFGALPGGYLSMTKSSDVDTQYKITNVNTSYWDFLFLERDGLNIDNLDNHEFVFVGLNNLDEQVHVWIDLLGMKPLKGNALDASYFPVITKPSTFDPSGLDIPGHVTISWTNPSGMSTDWINLGWNDGNNSTWMDIGNPAEDDPAKKYKKWTSYTFDTSETTVYPATNAWIRVAAFDKFDRIFEAHMNMY